MPKWRKERREKLEEIKKQIEEALKGWVQPDERLTVIISIQPLGVYKETLLDMLAQDYFSRERWLAAGMNTMMFIRVYNAVRNTLGPGPATVRDLANLGRLRLSKTSNVSKGTIQEIANFLELDDIKLSD